MTNPTVAVRAFALCTRVAQGKFAPVDTMTVTLPDGSIGVATTVHVVQACELGGHVAVRQGRRVDIWHASQLA